MKRILLLAMLLSTHAWAADDQLKLPATKTLATPGGRYVFGQISDFRRDQYMLDTYTGRLWQIVARPKLDAQGNPVSGGGEGPQILQIIPYLNVDDSVSVSPK